MPHSPNANTGMKRYCVFLFCFSLSTMPYISAIMFIFPLLPFLYTTILQNRKWSNKGCVSVYNAATPSALHCRCTHLTDFAVLLNVAQSRATQADSDDGVVSSPAPRLANSRSYIV